MYWRAALNMIRHHPIIGVGINTFVKAYPAYREAGDHFTQMGPYAHNMFLHQAAELGMSGLGVLLGLLGCIFGLVWRAIVTRGQPSLATLVCIGLGAGLCG